MCLINFVFYFLLKKDTLILIFFNSISRKILSVFHANRFHKHLLLDVHHSCVQLSQMEFLYFLAEHIKLN